MILQQGVVELLQRSGYSPQVLGVARNYRDHCIELGNPVPQRPNFFFKSPSSVIFPPDAIHIPQQIGNVEYEVEVAVAIGKVAHNISATEACDYIAGVTAVIDMTARSVQQAEKEKGLSWTLSKSLATFCPVCPDMVSCANLSDFDHLQVELRCNGELVQSGHTRDMIFKIPDLVSYLSWLFILRPGDLILTGTPAGVGPVVPGDRLTCSLTTQEGLHVETTFQAQIAPAVPPNVTQYPFF